MWQIKKIRNTCQFHQFNKSATSYFSSGSSNKFREVDSWQVDNEKLPIRQPPVPPAVSLLRKLIGVNVGTISSDGQTLNWRWHWLCEWQELEADLSLIVCRLGSRRNRTGRCRISWISRPSWVCSSCETSKRLTQCFILWVDQSTHRLIAVPGRF